MKSTALPYTLETLLIVTLLLFSAPLLAEAEQTYPEYSPQKIVYDFYFDDPQHINSALYWLRSVFNPLSEEPYNYSPDELSIKVIIHGTEIVTLAKKNYEKYQTAVERMRYYAEFGVEFKVCSLAAHDYDYAAKDFYDFVEMVPSAMTELVHWQEKGYSVLAPKILSKQFSIDEIR